MLAVGASAVAAGLMGVLAFGSMQPEAPMPVERFSLRPLEGQANGGSSCRRWA